MIEYCVVIADNSIIYGYDTDGNDHDKTIRDVVKKAQEVGKCFNQSKCQFKKADVKFFNMMLNRQGVVPDPAKIEASKKLPEPRTEILLQSSLGIVNYLPWFDQKLLILHITWKDCWKRQMNSYGMSQTAKILNV